MLVPGGPPLREWVFCFLSPFQSPAGPRPKTVHRKEVTKGRQASNKLIPEKAGDLSEAETGATFRFHIFSAFSTYYV